MVTMKCRTCGMLYKRPKSAPYKKLCPPCYKEAKGLKLTDADKSLLALNEDYKELANRYEALGRKYESLIHAYEVRAYREPSDFSQRVRHLIILCHPDKHNNSQTATEITQWLLSHRSKDVS